MPGLLVVADTMEGGLGAVAREHVRWFAARGWTARLADVPIPASARRVGSMAMAARRVRGERQRTDVVHVHGMRAAAVTLAAGVRHPFVTVHGVTAVASDPPLYHWARRATLAVLPRLTRLSSVGPSGVVFASPHLESLEGMPFPSPASTPTFAWIGALDERKRPEVFVRAIADVASTGVDVRGVIAGDGPRRDEIAMLVHTLAAPIDMLGPVPPSEALRAAWASTLFSDGEGVPLAVEEAMWARRSVVATRLPGTAHLIGMTGTLIDDPGDAAVALAALCDHEIARAAGEAAGRRIRAIVDPDQPWRTFEKLYLQSLDGEESRA